MPLSKDNNHALILDLVADSLHSQGFCTITHSRLSYESYKEGLFYQGLTIAEYNQQKVMIKWQLSPTNCAVQAALDIETANLKQVMVNTLNKGITQEVDSLRISAVPLISIGASLNNKLPVCLNSEQWQLDFFAMPYFHHGSVKDFLKANLLNQRQKYQLVKAMAHTIESLHLSGWIHGDIKPSNFLLDLQSPFAGRCLDSDDTVEQWKGFGGAVVTYLSDMAYSEPIKPNDWHNQYEVSCPQKQTRGTPAYLAPECWQGQPISIQSDIYAFGVTLYESLTGQKPYQVNSFDTHKLKVWATLHCQIEVPLLPEQWRFLQPIVDRLLAKTTENRYQAMVQVIEALDGFEYRL